MEVKGRKGDTILTGADELYHDEAFRANASPIPPILNVNNFLEITIRKPENSLKFPPTPYKRLRLFIGANAGSIPLLRVGIASSAGGGSSTMKDWTRFGQQAGSGKWSAAQRQHEERSRRATARTAC
jgi:hypothetical protein